MNVRGDTWTSPFDQSRSYITGVVDERIGELIQEILTQLPDHPEHNVLVLPQEGKAKCIELKESLDKKECDLYKDSELEINTYLEWNKAFLKQTCQWTTYVKTLECFARQKEGYLDAYLEGELSKEAIRKLLAQDKPDRKQLYELLKTAFASSTSLDISDLCILDQISKVQLMREEYFDFLFPRHLYKIEKAVFKLANKLKPYDIIDTSNPSLFKELAIWLKDSTAKGDKEEAVRRIISVWSNGVYYYLNLSALKLNKLPPVLFHMNFLQGIDLKINNLEPLPAEIGLLKNLIMLNVNENELESLTSGIYNLPKLEKLDLSDNNITELPTEIRRMSVLQHLMVTKNALHSLPSELWQLTNLTLLDLNWNNISLIPPQIRHLRKLERLILDGNNLQSLPPEIGQLFNLQCLGISCNSNLADIPMSIGNLPGITHLDIGRTQIRQEAVDAILGQCRMMRDKEALEILPTRLAKWQTIAKSGVDLTGIQSLRDDQKIPLNEWLLRLEKTRDFAHAQGPLAEIVCNMLEDVIKNKDFRELFFAQAEANNTACEDRAAMSLNEIYTSWKILNSSEKSLREKLELMARAAKTITLRNRIDELIAAEERKKFTKQISALEEKGVMIDKEMREKIQKQCEEQESVEIFLNYETALKQKLNLLSAIESMTYRTIGERSWIDPAGLEKHVNDNFFKELYELPVFQKELDPAIQAKMGAIEELYGEKLSNPPKDANEQQILDFAAEITQQQTSAKMKVAREWFDSLN